LQGCLASYSCARDWLPFANVVENDLPIDIANRVWIGGLDFSEIDSSHSLTPVLILRPAFALKNQICKGVQT
jgi:hypothetical protein